MIRWQLNIFSMYIRIRIWLSYSSKVDFEFGAEIRAILMMLSNTRDSRQLLSRSYQVSPPKGDPGFNPLLLLPPETHPRPSSSPILLPVFLLLQIPDSRCRCPHKDDNWRSPTLSRPQLCSNPFHPVCSYEPCERSNCQEREVLRHSRPG